MTRINSANEEPTIADLKEDLDQLREDLRQSLRQLRTDLRITGSDAAGVAQSSVRALHEELDDGIHAVAQQGREAVDGISEQVAAHPGATIVTAFAAGLIAGLLMPKRR